MARIHRHPFQLGLVLLLAACPAMAQQSPRPDYSPYSISRFLPFDSAIERHRPIDSSLHLRAQVGGTAVRVTLDTGSTGFAIDGALVPGHAPNTTPADSLGWEFLTSSNRLWIGRWVVQQVTFPDGGGGTVTATIPVLAVDTALYCPHYEPSDGRACPGGGTPTPFRGLAYMGVGFGREANDQAQDTPDKNAFLNVTAVDGVPVVPGTMRAGYLITQAGIQLGLTGANTAGFSVTPLVLRSDATDPRDWREATMCVAVDTLPCFQGSVLIDTGLPQMFLSLPPDVRLDSVRVTDPSQRERSIWALPDGHRITVRFPGAENPVASYGFVTGCRTDPLAPTVVVRVQDSNTFVNTGRNILKGFDVLFDASGWFGLRRIEPSVSPTGCARVD